MPAPRESGERHLPLMSDGMRTLLVFRHGKSDWDGDHDSDHERPLNDRGVRSARLMGRVLSARGIEPDAMISSTAVRAHTTAELAREAGGWRAGVTLEPRLYDSSPGEALSVAAGAPDLERVMLVGHQPTWSQLVLLVSGSEAELKTADVAVIEADIATWADLEPGCGGLGEILRSRDFLDSEWDRP